MTKDPVFVFIGDSKANFVIQTIYKCAQNDDNQEYI